MAALLTFYYFPSFSSLSFCLFLSFTLIPLLDTHIYTHTHTHTHTHTVLLAPYNTNVSRLSVTGERQWSRFDLDGSESEVTVIKGCSELLLALGHPLMNVMKQRWDWWTGRGRGMMEDRWQQPTRPSPIAQGAHFNTHSIRPIYPDGRIKTQMCTHAYEPCTGVKTTQPPPNAMWRHFCQMFCFHSRNKSPAISLHYSCAK